ncbi:MAG: PIN domain-containing protein [Candidatus Micrarchaeota archaeon]
MNYLDLVVDANVLFAVLIKESKTAELLFKDDLHLYSPDFVLQEFSKHEQELLLKTGRSREAFTRLLGILRRRIAVVPTEELLPFMAAAREVSPDPDDVPYFALALKLNAGIWSNDNRLQSQKKVRVWRTRDLV